MQESEVWFIIFILGCTASTSCSCIYVCTQMIRKNRPKKVLLKKLSPDCYQPLEQLTPSDQPLWKGSTQTTDMSLGTCFICCCDTATVVMLNCGHGALCLTCAKYLYLEQPLTCGFCRAPIVTMAHCLSSTTNNNTEEILKAVLCTNVA